MWTIYKEIVRKSAKIMLRMPFVQSMPFKFRFWNKSMLEFQFKMILWLSLNPIQYRVEFISNFASSEILLMNLHVIESHISKTKETFWFQLMQCEKGKHSFSFVVSSFWKGQRDSILPHFSELKVRTMLQNCGQCCLCNPNEFNTSLIRIKKTFAVYSLDILIGISDENAVIIRTSKPLNTDLNILHTFFDSTAINRT